MNQEEQYWLDILMYNKGFETPTQWIEYAKHNKFQKVKATRINCCPDCGCNNSNPLGQYVYYSTLITLQHCKECDLIFSNTHIDANVLAEHFELAYKDEAYFSLQRDQIFNCIAYLADINTPDKGKVLDIGGGLGHTLAILKIRRPDLSLTLNDISEAACRYASEKNSLVTICSPVRELVELKQKYDVVMLIDVIYYEPEIRNMWNIINMLLNEDGTLILRVPNKLLLIGLYQKLSNFFTRKDFTGKSSIKFFNPEHIFICSRKYLKKRLADLGFQSIEMLPSPLLVRSGFLARLYHSYYQTALILHRLTFGRTIVTPSFLVIARKFGH
ncbi:MAG: methyltransferase domain-containing protein [Deltaproteobacteria bacterium]